MIDHLIDKNLDLWVFFFKDKNIADETVFEEIGYLATRLKKIPKRALSYRISDAVNEKSMYPGRRSLKEAADILQQFLSFLQVIAEILEFKKKKQRSLYELYKIITDGKDSIDLLNKSLKIIHEFSKEADTNIVLPIEIEYLDERIKSGYVFAADLGMETKLQLSLLKDVAYECMRFIEERELTGFEYRLSNSNFGIDIFEDGSVQIKIGTHLDEKYWTKDQIEESVDKDRDIYQKFSSLQYLDLYSNVGRFALNQENVYTIPAGCDLKFLFSALQIVGLITYSEKQNLINELGWMF